MAAPVDVTEEKGWGGVDLVAQPKTLKTVADAIASVYIECDKDKFWADMGQPAKVALSKYKRASLVAEEDPAQAEKLRDEGFQSLKFLDEQLKSASQAGLFKTESRLVDLVVKTFEANPKLTLDAPLGAVAMHAQKEQASASAARTELEANVASSASLAQLKKHLRPYTFTQAQDDPEMTVVIDVPPETKTMDVKVKMTATTLYVSVKDHANQPVIEGRFLHAIRPEESAFHLEGSGEGRKLILDIEKASAGAQDWSPGLLVV